MDVDRELMNVGEVAHIFGVTTRTIHRWAESGALTCIRPTPSAHRKYLRHEVELLRDRSFAGDHE